MILNQELCGNSKNSQSRERERQQSICTFFHAFLLTLADQIAGNKNNADEQNGTSRRYGDDNYYWKRSPG